MRAEQPVKPPSSDEAPTQKQDPLERRRLQNRLSQRNHRRKIRDRIAKLQERVIANELRAAAALNGWDQPFPSPLLSPRHSTRQPNDLQVSSRDTSPMTTEQSTPFIPSYNITQAAPIWSNDFNFTQCSGWSNGDIPCNGDGRGLFNETMCLSAPDGSISAGVQLSIGNWNDGGLVHDSYTGMPANTSPGTPMNQPLYYVATETALPQILQAMSNISPQTKIIVLVPSDSASAYPSPSSPSYLGTHGLEGMSPSQTGIPNLSCQCQAQSANLPPNNLQTFSRWTAGSFSPGCPSHKGLAPPGGSFSALR